MNVRKRTPRLHIDRTSQMATKKATMLATTLPSHRSCDMRLRRPSDIGGKFAATRILSYQGVTAEGPQELGEDRNSTQLSTGEHGLLSVGLDEAASPSGI